jgi:enoyl-CoA hydratase/carnithine racemase
MNALSSELVRGLGAVLDALGSDGSVRTLVVWGGEKVFCAGADVKEMQSAFDEGRNPAAGVIEGLRPVLDSLAAFPRPTLAAINGFALGGGLEVALACDFRVAAQNARLGFPEILLGIFPGAGGTQRLPRLIGPARAKWMIFGGRPLPAPDALGIGLVDLVTPEEDCFDAALNEARRLCGGATRAQALAKRAIDEGLEMDLGAGLDLENGLFLDVFDTEDARAGIASFVEHGPGKASFSGR